MRISMYGTVLLGGVFLMAAGMARGQNSGGEQAGAAFLEVAITYDASRAVVISGPGFWLQGGSVQMHGEFWHGVGAVADIAGLHTGSVHNPGVGLDLVTATFGPRYTWAPRAGRYSLFGQALAGEVNGFNSIFPGMAQSFSSANGLAVQLGGGVNVPYKRRIGFRVFEADWLRTQLPNSSTSVQNNLRLGAGIVLLFR
jgi:hypothetical protein